MLHRAILPFLGKRHQLLVEGNRKALLVQHPLPAPLQRQHLQMRQRLLLAGRLVLSFLMLLRLVFLAVHQAHPPPLVHPRVGWPMLALLNWALHWLIQVRHLTRQQPLSHHLQETLAPMLALLNWIHHRLMQGWHLAPHQPLTSMGCQHQARLLGQQLLTQHCCCHSAHQVKRLMKPLHCLERHRLGQDFHCLPQHQTRLLGWQQLLRHFQGLCQVPWVAAEAQPPLALLFQAHLVQHLKQLRHSLDQPMLQQVSIRLYAI
jgi:hypothetical protein